MSETGPLAEAFVDIAFRLDRASEANLQRQVKATVSRLERSGAATIAPKAVAATTVGVSPVAAPNLFTRLAQGGAAAQLATTGAVIAVRQLDKAATEAAGSGVAELATTVSGADVALQRLGGRGAAAASRSMTDLRAATSGAAGSAAAGAGVWALGAAALTAQALAAKKSVEAFIGGADAVREFSQRSGLAAEDASRFVAVIDDFGIASTGGANSLFFLGRAVNENAAALERQGLRIARNKNGTVDLQETFFNLADAIKATDDPGRRFALIQATLGRQGRELIPVLELGGERLRDLFADVPSGQIFSARDLATTLAYNQAVDDVGDSIREIATNLGRELVPALTTTANWFAKSTRVAGRFFDVFNPIRDINDSVRTLTGSARDLGGVLETDADIAERVEEAFEKLNDEAAGLLTLVDAQMKSRDATTAIADANERVAEAQETLNVALARGGKFADDQARAMERLAATKERLLSLNRQLRDSDEAIGDAERELTEAQFRQGRQSREAIEAERALRNAREDRQEVEQAIGATQLDLREAQKDLTEAQKAGGRGSKEAAEAQRDLERAIDAQEKALRNAARSQAEMEIAQRQANGETVTAIDLAEEYQRQLVSVARTLAPSGELRNNILDTASALVKLFEFDAAGGGDFSSASIPALTGRALSPGAISGGSLAPGAVPSGALGGNAVGVGGLSSVSIEQNFYNQQDPLALATDTAWLLTQRGAGSLLRAGAI